MVGFDVNKLIVVAVLWIAVHGQREDVATPSELMSVAHRVGLFSGGNASRVGFLVHGVDQLVVLPEFYSKFSDRRGDLLDDVSLLRSVLRKYDRLRRSIDELSAGEPLAHVSGPALDITEILSFLVDDFKINGPLDRRREEVACDVSGQVLWHRTLSGSNWLEGSVDGDFLPREIRYKKKIPHTSDAVAILHRHALRVANKMLNGGLLGEFGLPPDDRDLFGIGVIDQKLNSELARTFRRRERRVLCGLRDFYSKNLWCSSDKSTLKTSFYFLANFEYVWEDLLRSGIGAEISDELPPCGMSSFFDGSSGQGIQPIPDLIINLPDVGRKRCGLIDGKYYMSRGLDPVASAGDHYKQVIYSQLINQGGCDVKFNLLAFPDVLLSGKVNARLLRRHEWVNLPGSTIYECAIDYRRLASAYIHAAKKVDLNHILDDLSIVYA